MRIKAIPFSAWALKPASEGPGGKEGVAESYRDLSRVGLGRLLPLGQLSWVKHIKSSHSG